MQIDQLRDTCNSLENSLLEERYTEADVEVTDIKTIVKYIKEAFINEI